MRILLAALLLSGCSAAPVAGEVGPVGPAGPAGMPGIAGRDGVGAYVAGSRLRPVTRHALDGASQFVGWQDINLGMRCEFRVAEDGQTRCLPVAARIDYPGYGFADAACTIHLTSQFAEACGLSYAWRPLSLNCGETRVQLYRIGQAVHPGDTVYSGDPGNCVAAIGDQEYVAVTVADPSEFVAATDEVQP
jgi:hypothetical protein